MNLGVIKHRGIVPVVFQIAGGFGFVDVDLFVIALVGNGFAEVDLNTVNTKLDHFIPNGIHIPFYRLGIGDINIDLGAVAGGVGVIGSVALGNVGHVARKQLIGLLSCFGIVFVKVDRKLIFALEVFAHRAAGRVAERGVNQRFDVLTIQILNVVFEVCPLYGIGCHVIPLNAL